MNTDIDIKKVAQQLLNDFTQEHYTSVVWKTKVEELMEENKKLKAENEKLKGEKKNAKNK